MSSQPIATQTILAQTPQPAPPADGASGISIWMFASLGLLAALVGTVVYGKLLIDKKEKAIKFEQYKAHDLQKRLKLALKTIQKMEANPDLIHSREFNLDYLRLRMDEEVFH
ncbi:MAG: hypothetical protein SAJ12_14995, partial [Jaaginema sp. PMC 1079.18]|nr:hypothetical protein [Jaaginema sp. PMC 1079.18]